MSESLEADTFPTQITSTDGLLLKLPIEARQWAESLPWLQRRYVLSLCHLMCAASPDTRAQFLDDYTADGLISKVLEDRDTQHHVQKYLKEFKIDDNLDTNYLRRYIRQFYIHSAQDMRTQPDLYLESALRLVMSTEERNHVLCYVLGFELIKMMFRMSWYQHEKLYRLQRNQEEFIQTYVKPIQHAHRINQIIIPKDENLFFARRQYYVQEPSISEKKLTELAIATFTTEKTTQFGFSIIRHPQALVFDYHYIFDSDSDAIFQ